MKFIPVTVDDLTIFVSNDYYKVKGVRIPMGYSDTLQLIDSLNVTLPSSKEMVDAIYSQASIKLEPMTMPPGPNMSSKEYWERHNQMIENQLKEHKNVKNKLIAGHKKDIMFINRTSKRVAIYGWHRLNGKPIQPYSTVHGRDYFDYSHGIRLIKKEAIRNGETVLLNV